MTISKMMLMGLFVLSLGGCGLAGDAGRCDFRDEGGSAPRCQEWNSNLPNAQMSYKLGCEMSGGVYSDEGCPRGDSVGGCRQNTNNADGSETVDFYYPPRTVDETKMACMTAGEDYVEP